MNHAHRMAAILGQVAPNMSAASSMMYSTMAQPPQTGVAQAQGAGDHSSLEELYRRLGGGAAIGRS